MKPPQTLRSLVPLVIGLALGGVGAVSFMESLPGVEGSPEERANQLELELKRAQNRIAALEAADAQGGLSGDHAGKSDAAGNSKKQRSRRTFADGARSIGEDIRAGRPISPDDIFRTTKPILRDLAPLFDRIRVKQEQELIDGMTGELARKYHLTQENQAALKQWFEQKSAEEAKRWSELIGADSTRLEDVIRASRDVRPDAGLDAFMEGILPADQLPTFQAERLTERAERVQQEADGKVQRLDAIVGLDESQRDRIFGVMARGSRDYDPAMVLEGSHGEIGMTPGGDRHSAVLSVLRPDQRAAYEAERKRRYEEAAKDAASIGLTLPGDWELLDDTY